MSAYPTDIQTDRQLSDTFLQCQLSWTVLSLNPVAYFPIDLEIFTYKVSYEFNDNTFSYFDHGYT